MRILIIGLNFHPELTGIGKYSTEMAAYLSRQGHLIQVVTTPPYYPFWKVQPGYHWWGYHHENWAGVEIYRCPLWVPHRPTGFKRILHLLSFALSSLPILLTRWRWHPDIIICVAPALFSAPGAFIAARLSKSPSWLHIQDFELDAALELGLLSANQFIKTMALRWEHWLLGKFDRVSTISDRMLKKLIHKGLSADRTALFPNWVDIDQIYPLQNENNSLRAELGIPMGKHIVLYAGNLGEKQGVDILVQVAHLMQPHPDIIFVIVGQGAARTALEEQAAGLQNILFYPLQPIEKLNNLLNLADIHVLPQRADIADLVMPSKLTGMLASGKPVIATAMSGTGVAEIVQKVGIVVPPGQPEALINAILELTRDPQKLAALGQQGRSYIEKHWAADPVLKTFMHSLVDTVTEGSWDQSAVG